MSQIIPVEEGRHLIELTKMSPAQSERAFGSDSDSVCWLGRCWRWIQEKIINPILNFFASMCQTEKVLEMRPLQTDPLQEPEELKEASESMISKPLPNLGSTCYVNASLQLIARLNFFNAMLTTPIVDNDAYTDIERDLIKYREELRSHLCAIIHKMRGGDPDSSISREMMETLYTLLRKAGWNKNKYAQQDAHEFLNNLCDILSCPKKLIHSIAKMSCELREKYNDTVQSDFELLLPIPVDAAGKLPANYASMNDLLPFYRESMIEGYKPYKDAPGVKAHKTLFFVDTETAQAPDTLFIELKRFDQNPDGTFKRIDARMPYTPYMEIPIYEKRDTQDQDRPYEMVVKETRLYKFKAAILHHSTCCGGGHYTTLTQNQDAHNELLIQYNDRRTPNVAKAGSANGHKELIASCGYVFAYELEEVVPGV